MADAMIEPEGRNKVLLVSSSPRDKLGFRALLSLTVNLPPITPVPPRSDNGGYVNKTGVNRAPEWKDDFDHATQERTLFAVV